MEKFVSPSPPPEGIERELLTILAEECCEVGQRVSKALRFGIDEVQPEQDLTNADRIMLELGDIMAVIDFMEDLGIVNRARITDFQVAKRPKLERYLQTR